MTLATIAPRLAHARDLHNAEVAWREGIRRRAAAQLPSVERLVAHRDLQLIRAYSTGDGRYIDRRRDKLKRAQAKLHRLKIEAGIQ